MTSVTAFDRFRAAASDLASRFGLASRAGLTFGGKRDLYDVLGYSRLLRPEDFRARYKRNGIAARVVEAKPHATWRGGVEVIEDEDPTVETQFEEELNALAKRLSLWAVLNRADVLAGLGRYSVVLIGVPGKLEEPLPNSFSADDILYLTPFAEEDALVETWDSDESSERFGQPLFYKLSRTTSTTSSSRSVTQSSFAKRVHYSRLLHIADGTLDDLIYGQPRLERIWNWLDDLEKVTGAGAEAFWLRAHQGLHLDVDKELDITPEQSTVMKDAADDLTHGFRRVIVTRGTELNMLGSDVAMFDKPVDAILTLISGATGIPKRILVGSERGELASTQDRENWNDLISDRRKDFAGPRIIQPFVELLIEHGALPEPAEFNVRWPEVQHLTKIEQADVADKWAGLNTKAGGTVVLPEEIRERALDLPPFTDEQLAAIEEEEAANAAMAAQISGQNPPADPADPNAEPPEDGVPKPVPKAARGKVPPRERRGRGMRPSETQLLRIEGGSRA